MDRRRWQSITGASDHREHVEWRQVDREVDEDSNAHDLTGLRLVTTEVNGALWYLLLEVDGDV